MRVPWTARRSNKSTLKEISPGWSLEGLMLKLKLQYFGHFFITNNEKSERKIKESITFTIATKRIKYLGINLPKETNYKEKL